MYSQCDVQPSGLLPFGGLACLNRRLPSPQAWISCSISQASPAPPFDARQVLSAPLQVGSVELPAGSILVPVQGTQRWICPELFAKLVRRPPQGGYVASEGSSEAEAEEDESPPVDGEAEAKDAPKLPVDRSRGEATSPTQSPVSGLESQSQGGQSPASRLSVHSEPSLREKAP